MLRSKEIDTCNHGVAALSGIHGRLASTIKVYKDGMLKAFLAAIKRKSTFPKFTYDLANAPASYDFLVFLAICGTYAQGAFDLDILPGPNHGFREDDLEPTDIVSRQQLLDNVLIPATRVFPVRRLSLFPEQSGGVRLPYTAKYLNREGPIVGCRAPEWAMRNVMQRYPRRPVVITIRASHYHSVRNSSINEWNQVADELKVEHPVVVLNDGFLDDISLPIRAALYEWAELNLSVNNGPCALMYLNSAVRYLIFKPTAPSKASSMQYWNYLGIQEGSGFRWANAYQRLIWKEDLAANILPAAKEMLELCARHHDGDSAQPAASRVSPAPAHSNMI